VSGPPPWDDAFADQLEGAVILVGVTRASSAGERKEQFHGVVEAAIRNKGVLLHLPGSREGETFWLPPDLGSLTPAGPVQGRYRAGPLPAARDGGSRRGPGLHRDLDDPPAAILTQARQGTGCTGQRNIYA